MLTYRLMKPPRCSLLIRVFPISDQGSVSRSFHRRPIKQNRRHKLNWSLIRPKGQADLGESGSMRASPENFGIVGCQRCDFMHFGGQGVTDNQLFVIIKILLSSWNVSICKSWFIVYMCTNFNDRNRWLHSILQSGSIPPFYWEPWCQLACQQSNHPKCLETTKLLS